MSIARRMTWIGPKTGGVGDQLNECVSYEKSKDISPFMNS